MANLQMLLMYSRAQVDLTMSVSSSIKKVEHLSYFLIEFDMLFQFHTIFTLKIVLVLQYVNLFSI